MSLATTCLIKKKCPLGVGYSAVRTWGVFYLPLKHPAISTGRNKTPDHRDSRPCRTGQSFRSHLQTHQTLFRQQNVKSDSSWHYCSHNSLKCDLVGIPYRAHVTSAKGKRTPIVLENCLFPRSGSCGLTTQRITAVRRCPSQSARGKSHH